jgi:phage replication-related protein YjqB (UPF0714/DUF867 family)
MAIHDKYQSFKELSAIEIEGKDFRRIIKPVKSSNIAIIAPHGGGIEFETSRICREIAGDEFNCYIFEGIKPRNNIDLHITSHNFNDPLCLELLSTCDQVISVHGFRARKECVVVGGLDTLLMHKFKDALLNVGIQVAENHKFPASNPNNICNRGFTNKGVQIEISGLLRRSVNIDKLIVSIRNILLNE